MSAGDATPDTRPEGDGVVVWRVSDGLAGHDNQSLGLAEALARRVPVDPHTLPARALGGALARWLSGRYPELDPLPGPDLIIGAGHGTHATMLAARRCRGGRAVVLMSPSLPVACFDLCIAPAHDGLRGPRVIVTRGALNRVRPRPPRTGGPGLVLLGGPSRHFLWRDDSVLEKTGAVLAAASDSEWIIATSRRTPAALAAKLESLTRAGVTLVRHESTGSGWLAEALARASRVWVTEDSVSMIYEALTSGAPVGLIGLDRAGTDGVCAEIDRLAAEGWVRRIADHGQAPGLEPPPEVLDEAGRCAGILLERWPELRR
ncbi:MAG: mitochondrial fission ELM1 family protein [Gammaproteobacteria bacterium]|nr:mitochondrial fission ELM1 family protein [Gammaproteobacteria bacterium]